MSVFTNLRRRLFGKPLDPLDTKTRRHIALAAFFAWHVLWPGGFGGRFDAFSLVVGLAALAALWRYKVGIIPVIFACGAAGLLYRLVSG